MASADLVDLTNIISDSIAAHGVTSGTPPMLGGGPNVWAFNSSASSSQGALARKYIGSAPLPVFDKGSIISGAMVRYISVGSTGYSVCVYTCLGNSQTAIDVNGIAYMLGLQDADPCHIVLVKGAVSNGLLAGNVGDQGILRKSVDAVALGEWVHLMLDCTVQANGDVHIQCMRSTEPDLTNPPAWVAIDGMDLFTDDVTKINSGSDPLLEGPPGYAWFQSEPNRAGAVDHLNIQRQTIF